MDGTLTLPVHDFTDIRRQLGIQEDKPILEAIMEMPADQGAQLTVRLNEIELEIAELAEPQPGTTELLDTLVGGGRKVGILTRNDEDIAEATLKASGLSHYFQKHHIIGRETCAPKPLPDGVLYLLNKWSAPPSKTVMVGDFLYDIEAGKRAGCRTVHFDSTGNFNWPEFMDHGVTRISDICDLVR